MNLITRNSPYYHLLKYLLFQNTLYNVQCISLAIEHLALRSMVGFLNTYFELLQFIEIIYITNKCHQ